MCFLFGSTARFYFSTVMRYLSFLYHYALAELVSGLKCSIGGSQATRVSFGFLMA